MLDKLSRSIRAERDAKSFEMSMSARVTAYTAQLVYQAMDSSGR